MSAATGHAITVAKTLEGLDGPFGVMARAIEGGEFALWVGSGISKKAPNLGKIIERGLESLRQSATAPAAPPAFETALKEAMALAKTPWANVSSQLGAPFETWPQAKAIVHELWGRYSELLDIRVAGRDDDYMLWEAVNVRDAFANPAPPQCEHLCIAMLVLEGAVTEIASANWDGFIEAAIERLSGGATGMLQVVVDPNHLRDGPGRARLLKFHGCIVHATQQPALYRDFLIGSASQITTWPTMPAYTAIRTEVVSVATTAKALMVGLSLQDSNLQWVFAAARTAHPWPWPSHPAAQGHVFCEEMGLGPKQRAMLKVVYGGAFTPHQADIETSAVLPSWPEQVLLALTLKLLCDKLAYLAVNVLQGTVLQPDAPAIVAELTALRDDVAAGAEGNRTDFTNTAITAWSRGLKIFRSGRLPLSPETYEVLSLTGMAQIGGDANTLTSGLGEAAIGLALLRQGQASGDWHLALPAGAALNDGALQVTGTWSGATPARVYFVRSAAEAITLRQQGAFANDNVVVVHSDDAWVQMQPSGVRPPSARRAKRAPGRTGIPSVRHVSVRELVTGASSLATLATKFRERAGL